MALIDEARDVEELLAGLQKILAGRTDDLAALARQLGLDPAIDFRGADLAGIDLHSRDLRDFDFAGADLTGADLRGARLYGDQLYGAKLSPPPRTVPPRQDTPIPREYVPPPLGSRLHVVLEDRKERSAHLPESYEQLLTEPIVEVQDGGRLEARSYPGWEYDHFESRRFYVAGMRSFLEATGARAEDLNRFRESAMSRIAGSTNWPSRDHVSAWREQLGRPQVARAVRGEAMTFAKAAQVIVACEMLLEDRLSRDRPANAFTQPGDVYALMGIVPACWHIDGFDETFIKSLEQESENATQMIAAELGARNTHFVSELARGSTITREAAEKVYTIAKQRFRAGSELGYVRVKPGRRLGRGGAADSEYLDLG